LTHEQARVISSGPLIDELARGLIIPILARPGRSFFGDRRQRTKPDAPHEWRIRLVDGDA